jgi:hypothetical protein
MQSHWATFMLFMLDAPLCIFLYFSYVLYVICISLRTVIGVPFNPK